MCFKVPIGMYVDSVSDQLASIAAPVWETTGVKGLGRLSMN